MYLAVAATIVGQWLLLGRLVLLLYAACFAVVVYAFVRWYEEPALRHGGSASSTKYQLSVPGWWPPRRPWKPSARASNNPRRSAAILGVGDRVAALAREPLVPLGLVAHPRDRIGAGERLVGERDVQASTSPRSHHARQR